MGFSRLLGRGSLLCLFFGEAEVDGSRRRDDDNTSGNLDDDSGFGVGGMCATCVSIQVGSHKHQWFSKHPASHKLAQSFVIPAQVKKYSSFFLSLPYSRR